MRINELKNINAFQLVENKLPNKIPLFIVVLLFDIVLHLTLSLIINSINPELTEVFDENVLLSEVFFLTVIFGPLIETILFQYFIIEILWLFKLKEIIIVLFSALIFAISHYYNVYYAVFSLLPGILYASYYVYLKKYKGGRPFLFIWALHGLYNLWVFLIDDWLEIF